jgi:hypothetical protein
MMMAAAGVDVVPVGSVGAGVGVADGAGVGVGAGVEVDDELAFLVDRQKVFV